MSIEKFIVVYFPLKTKSICTVRTARIVSLVTASVFFPYDLQFFLFTTNYEDSSGSYCYYVNFPSKYWTILFGVVDAILYVYAPFLIMILAYSAIVYKFMLVKWRCRQGSEKSTSQTLSKSATTGIAMLFTVSLAFVVLTAPIMIVNAVWPNGIPLLIFSVCLALEYMSHAINGVLYCVSGSRFKNELKLLLKCSQINSHNNIHTITSSHVNSSIALTKN